MKAIPTEYNGILMRSRLEADWALNLDNRGIPWQYEVEGFELSDGSWYSPDFYLPGIAAWLEVKGDHDQRIDKVEQFAADLWAESGCTTTYDSGAPMVLLGRPPAVYGLCLVGVMGHGKGYSVGITRCPACDTTVVVALWQPECRACHRSFTDPQEAFMDAHFRMLEPWARLDRSPA